MEAERPDPESDTRRGSGVGRFGDYGEIGGPARAADRGGGVSDGRGVIGALLGAGGSRVTRP